MGFISSLASGKQTKGADSSRNLWREVFGVDKESGGREPKREKPIVPGGSYARSSLSTDASVIRLVEAMRSKAPGGWSDDRYEQTKHFVGIVYAAIHRISMQFSQAEFAVFRKDKKHQDGKRSIEEDDPAYRLVELLEKPNHSYNFGGLMYRISQQIRLTGTSFIWMMPNKIGTPMELYSIPTAIAIPQATINPDYPHGFFRIQPIYPYGPFSSYPTPNSAVGAAIPSEWMLRFQYPHPLLHYDGYSPLTGMRLHIDEVEAMDRSRWYSMKRGIHPSAVLNQEKMEGAQALPEAEQERIRAQFEADYQGPEGHGRLYIAPPGSALEMWGTSPLDMDYSEGWRQLTSFVMGAGFGITPPAAGMVEDSSYATLFATLKQLHLTTLDPDCGMIGSGFTSGLAPYFGDDLIVEVRCKRIDDHDIQNTRIDKLISAKAITKGEVRKEYELPLWGDERDNQIAGTEDKPQQQQPGEEETPEAPKTPHLRGGPRTAGVVHKQPKGKLGTGDSPLEPAESKGPDTGSLGEGALGPRKHFQRKLLVNGNGRH